MTQSLLTQDALGELRVRALAEAQDITLDHPSQLHFLTTAQSVDIQAAPGSGKTTLTALKLCAVARGWQSHSQGICVISHTNAAKDQIRERLQGDRFGRALLRQPHFIGTIQGFVDTFLGLPYARSRGISVRFIDNETYAAEAVRRFDKWKRLSKLYYYLSRRQNGRDLIARASYAFDGNDRLSVRPEGLSFPAGPATESFKQYVDLKDSMARDGYFRFHDMYAFARHMLYEHRWVATAVATRFPWVIIDEMQDTSADQETLLEQVLPAERVVVQRIGDQNQRIFDDAEEAGFPGPDSLQLPVSRRFGWRIAKVVGSLTMRRPQKVVGCSDREAGQLLLILFDQATATQVIRHFVHEAETWVSPAERDDHPLRAVAGRTDSSQAQAFPRTLQSYVPDFRPGPTVAAASTTRSLVEAVRRAQNTADSGDQREAVTILWGSLATVADLCGVQSAWGRLTGARLRRMVRGDYSLELGTRRLLRHLLEEAITGSHDGWQQTVQHVRHWDLLATRAYGDHVAQYCAYADPQTVNAEASASPVLPPGVTVRSIHSAKGETHCGTLLLECLDSRGNAFDLVEALKVITGRKSADELSGSALAACQLVFVAVSRPQSLLAFAVLAEHAEPYLDDLHEQGWRIADLREPET